jgi:ech hydrogenase subunit B
MMLEIIFIALVPILGGVIYGFERVVRARMQNRVGPPILQPFYDMYKLLDKVPILINSYHIVFALLHMLTLWIVVAMVVLGFHLLYIIFVHLIATIFLVVAGYSVRSVYSHVGANRELIAMVAYEPILILIAIGFYLVYGSFDTGVIFSSVTQFDQMILLFLAFLLIIPVKLKKSPFDATEAHQEIVGGVEIEYGGVFFEILYMAKWIEYVFIFALIYLFSANSFILGTILSILVFFVLNLVDNSTARVRIDHLFKLVLGFGLILSLINIIGVVYV